MCLSGREGLGLDHRSAGEKHGRASKFVGAVLGPIKRFVEGHPLWMAALSGVGVSLAFLLALPIFLKTVVAQIQISGGNPCWSPDWFSFFGSWIPGTASAAVGIVSVMIAIRISNQQSDQAKRLNSMQTSLTMAMNLPSLHISQVKLQRTKEFLLAGHSLPGAGQMQYKVELHTSREAFPAHYQVELLQCSWKFLGRDREQIHVVQLNKKCAKLSLAHTGVETCLILDFDIAQRDKDCFERFYDAPELNLDGIRYVRVKLILKLENCLLGSVLRSSGMDGDGQKPESTVELCIQLRNSGKYVRVGDGSFREPDIVVENYSVSVL